MATPYVQTVLVPCLKSDLEHLRFMLSCWSDARMKPLSGAVDGSRPRTLMVLLNQAPEEFLDEIRDLISEFSELNDTFSQVLVKSAGLDGDRDIYVRGSIESKGEFGNKAGPNFLFFEAMKQAADLGDFVFQCELDCYPLQPGWLEALDQVVAENPAAWVIGSNYCGHNPINDDIQFHINGNALYKAGDPAFQAFLVDVWQTRLHNLIYVDPNLAYDCWWATEQSRASISLKNRSWHLVAAYGSRFVARPMIFNLLIEEDFAKDIRIYRHLHKMAEHSCALLHAGYVRERVASYLETDETDMIGFLETSLAQSPSDTPFIAPLAREMALVPEEQSPVEENELTLEDIKKVNSTSTGDYGDILVDMELRSALGDFLDAIRIRFQVWRGDRMLEFRPRDNLIVSVGDTYSLQEDEWGPALRLMLNRASLPTEDELASRVAKLESLDGNSISFDQVLLVLLKNWNAINKTLETFSPEVWSQADAVKHA